MQPPTKDQADIGAEDQTLDASASDENPDRARQEGKDEADITYMLSRLGVAAPRGAPTYGTVDDSIDLQIALESLRDARSGYASLPDNLKARFTSMEQLLNAIENGSLVVKNDIAPEEPALP